MKIRPLARGVALTLGAAVVLSGAIVAPAFAEGGQDDEPLGATEATEAEMPTIGGNLGSQRYSALDDIDHRTLDRLAPAWRTHVSEVAPASDDAGQQTAPIVVGGVMYFDTPSGGVIALDGATGEAKWKWENHDIGMSSTRRGVSAGEGRIYTLAGDNHVVALDQDTGEELWSVQPVGDEGEDIGRVAKAATVYSEGTVYVHAADGDRGAVVALDASDGSHLWHFFGSPTRGEVFTNPDGSTFDASETWGPAPAEGEEDCSETGGATSWISGSADPELGLYYATFGNPRSCDSSQDGSGRPGDNLFSSTIVALDVETGEHRWHYQSIHHDVWDMDNVHSPTFADTEIGGEERQVLFYGAKSGHQFVLDRATGEPLRPVEDAPMITDDRQHSSSTQPIPEAQLLPECIAWQKLDPENVPGDPYRGVPNYNGYQPDEDGNLVFNPDSYVAADEEHLTYPAGAGDHREGCLYDPHWDQPILSTTSPNGGADWSAQAFSHRTGLVYFPYGTNPVAHWREARMNGQRAIGQYQTGGILAYDPTDGEVVWRNHLGTDMSHGQGPLVTAGGLLFVGQADGRLLAMDDDSGEVLWEFQTGSSIGSPPVTYTVDGEQYLAVFAAGTTNPYGQSITAGDSMWAFKLDGDFTAESGSQEGPLTAPLQMRRPVQGGGAVDGDDVGNTVLLAREDRTSDTAEAADSVSQTAMQPTHLRVSVGETVTFLNPGTETFPDHPNQREHCATQFFEGEFHAKLAPGESYEHEFTRPGEYFFNDCTDPRPTGKIEVVFDETEHLDGALSFRPGTLAFTGSTFNDVRGSVRAHLELPNGYAYDGGAQLVTPLGLQPIEPADVKANRNRVILTFDKADLDNNVPDGATSLTVEANVATGDGLHRIASSAEVEVKK
ncbi:MULTISPECIES: outer membrane protein assembly factor BamB family protein [unclassified Microbacterium]|uniref:outer membrane protein assembly factor BamB family protein n=1 Tax=unclassified Microbacterium TaxID=2609290 RepID=UPI00097F2C00|nr:PQQ-binding-like beta-propeller repeat protein [Microbacterium sp. JB110]RCS61999.1 dehydrogenase [Microbacterium sp. JB110]SJM67100.1 Quino(hemo)protein alcohol dehydrogenase, PQQ-dependent [Frigoribacterium sp. JB110]